MCNCVFNQDGTYTLCKVCVDIWKDLLSGKCIIIDKEEYSELQKLYSYISKSLDDSVYFGDVEIILNKLKEMYKDPF